jgi:hypothetical protein
MRQYVTVVLSEAGDGEIQEETERQLFCYR